MGVVACGWGQGCAARQGPPGASPAGGGELVGHRQRPRPVEHHRPHVGVSRQPIGEAGADPRQRPPHVQLDGPRRRGGEVGDLDVGDQQRPRRPAAAPAEPVRSDPRQRAAAYCRDRDPADQPGACPSPSAAAPPSWPPTPPPASASASAPASASAAAAPASASASALAAALAAAAAAVWVGWWAGGGVQGVQDRRGGDRVELAVQPHTTIQRRLHRHEPGLPAAHLGPLHLARRAQRPPPPGPPKRDRRGQRHPPRSPPPARPARRGRQRTSAWRRW